MCIVWHVPSRLFVSSTWTLSESLSAAAKAENMVASVSVPLASRAFAVRPCSVKFPCVVSTSVYSPRPLKVYTKPSSVRMCGSPNSQPMIVKKNDNSYPGKKTKGNIIMVIVVKIYVAVGNCLLYVSVSE